IEAGMDITGTDGDDLFLDDPSETGAFEETLLGGEGDDTILLERGFGADGVIGALIDGEAGDDILAVDGDVATILGGDGDDTIEADVFASFVSGGAGNDVMTVDGGASDPTRIEGNAGDDIIDARGSLNVAVLGGTGDDQLFTDGRVPLGTGYTMSSDGGAGDDLLRHEITTFPPALDESQYGPTSLTGGEGADQFEVVLGGGGGVFSEDPGDPDSVTVFYVDITDFERGTDTIVVEVGNVSSSYTPTVAELEEDTGAGTTTLSVLLEGTSLPDQNIQIRIGATGLTFDDITFVGDPMPTLIT
ncbi:MAG: hypothetical protein AAGP08_19195, partial [Pseudomonadota bacterium]